MKCNYYRYGMTNCPLIFGNIRRKIYVVVAGSFVCIKLFQHPNGQYHLTVGDKCKVKVANKRANLDTIPALLWNEAKEIDFH